MEKKPIEYKTGKIVRLPKDDLTKVYSDQISGLRSAMEYLAWATKKTQDLLFKRVHYLNPELKKWEFSFNHKHNYVTLLFPVGKENEDD